MRITRRGQNKYLQTGRIHVCSRPLLQNYDILQNRGHSYRTLTAGQTLETVGLLVFSHG